MSYTEKFLNFVEKLYAKIGEDETVKETVKESESDVCIELRIKGLPDLVWQIGSKSGKWFANKGAKDTPTAIIEYLNVKVLNDFWSGRMAPDALFSQGGMLIVEGSIGDLGFMEPVLDPLLAVYQELKAEFPGLPP